MRFLGVASSTRRDAEGESIAPEALEKMAQRRGIPLLPGHRARPQEALGVVEECWTGEGKLHVRGRLKEDNPRAPGFFLRLLQGRPFALSVGGRIRRARRAPEGRVLEEVDLEHVAVCRQEQAKNPDTWVAAEGEVEGRESEVGLTSRPLLPAGEGEEETRGAGGGRVGAAATPAARSEAGGFTPHPSPGRRGEQGAATAGLTPSLAPRTNPAASLRSGEHAAGEPPDPRSATPPPFKEGAGGRESAGETPAPLEHPWPVPLSVQVEALREEITTLQARLTEAEARAARAEREKEELALKRAQVQPGRRQSLPLTGPVPRAKTNDNLWKGVL